MRAWLILTGCWLGTATALGYWLCRGDRVPDKPAVLADTPALVFERLRTDDLRWQNFQVRGELVDANARVARAEAAAGEERARADAAGQKARAAEAQLATLRVLLDAARRDAPGLPGVDVRPEDRIPPQILPVR